MSPLETEPFRASQFRSRVGTSWITTSSAPYSEWWDPNGDLDPSELDPQVAAIRFYAAMGGKQPEEPSHGGLASAKTRTLFSKPAEGLDTGTPNDELSKEVSSHLKPNKVLLAAMDCKARPEPGDAGQSAARLSAPVVATSYIKALLGEVAARSTEALGSSVGTGSISAAQVSVQDLDTTMESTRDCCRQVVDAVFEELAAEDDAFDDRPVLAKHYQQAQESLETALAEDEVCPQAFETEVTRSFEPHPEPQSLKRTADRPTLDSREAASQYVGLLLKGVLYKASSAEGLSEPSSVDSTGAAKRCLRALTNSIFDNLAKTSSAEESALL